MDNLNTLTPNQKDFWYHLFKDLCSEKIQAAIMNVFKDTLNYRMKNLTSIEKEKIGTKNYTLNKKAEIVKDFKKYHLGAHTDNYTKLKGLCKKCADGTEAIFTKRIVNNSKSQVLVGSEESYEAVCRFHYLENFLKNLHYFF